MENDLAKKFNGQIQVMGRGGIEGMSNNNYIEHNPTIPNVNTNLNLNNNQNMNYYMNPNYQMYNNQINPIYPLNYVYDPLAQNNNQNQMINNNTNETGNWLNKNNINDQNNLKNKRNKTAFDNKKPYNRKNNNNQLIRNAKNIINTKYITPIKEKNRNQTKSANKNKENFNNSKQVNIERLKDQIKNIESEIKTKRDFFCSLQPMSDKFLNRLNDTYVRDYVPNKIRLNVKYNEHNISNVFDNISNYYKLITELEQSVDSKTMDNSNKILESLGNDFNSTLDNFMHDSFLNPKIIKQEHKNAKGDYEQTIRRLAENFINLSNTSGFSGFNTTKSKMKEY